MSKELSNPKTEVPCGIELNDKDYLNSLLSSLKDMTKTYAVSLTEVSNEKLFNTYFDAFKKIVDLQRETFELAFKNGWYTLEAAEETKISTKHETLKKEFDDLNC